MIVVSAKDLTKAYGTDVILDKVSFHINKGDRVGIIGINGAGKSTLLKMLTGEMSCESGDYFISADTKIGYLKHGDGEFESENTVIEEVDRIFDQVPENGTGDGTASAADRDRRKSRMRSFWRSTMPCRKNINNRAVIPIRVKSRVSFRAWRLERKATGKRYLPFPEGERTRLALACLLLKKPDILFLDEPTNHLDIGTLKWLEQYLKNYNGTIVLVSHDRYFLDQTVNRIFEIENHKLTIYEGNYSFYATERKVRREAEFRKFEKQQKEIRRQEDMIRRFKQRGTEKLAKRAASRERRLGLPWT